MTGQLTDILRLARLIRDTELESLSRAFAQLETVSSERKKLRAAQQTSSSMAAKDSDYTRIVDARWFLWARNELTQLSQREARAASKVEQNRISASKALGRAKVIEEMIEKSRAKPKRN